MSALVPGDPGIERKIELIRVPIGRWAVAAAPARIQTLLGSCVGVALHDRLAKLGGLAHIVLPNSRGSADHPGKYADTSIPGLLGDLRKLGSPSTRSRLAAKIVGGASMFRVGEAGNIGQANQAAVERILAELGIPIVARDLGGESGRRIVLDTATGQVSIHVPGGAEHQI